MSPVVTDLGEAIVWHELRRQLGCWPAPLEVHRACRAIEASVDRALSPTAEVRQHANGTCWCRYITIPEEYVEWVG